MICIFGGTVELPPFGQDPILKSMEKSGRLIPINWVAVKELKLSYQATGI